MMFKVLKEIWLYNKGKITGVFFGLVGGTLIIIMGFLKTLFITFCLIVGYIIGKKIDQKENILDILEKLLRKGHHK